MSSLFCLSLTLCVLAVAGTCRGDAYVSLYNDAACQTSSWGSFSLFEGSCTNASTPFLKQLFLNSALQGGMATCKGSFNFDQGFQPGSFALTTQPNCNGSVAFNATWTTQGCMRVDGIDVSIPPVYATFFCDTAVSTSTGGTSPPPRPYNSTVAIFNDLPTCNLYNASTMTTITPVATFSYLGIDNSSSSCVAMDASATAALQHVLGAAPTYFSYSFSYVSLFTNSQCMNTIAQRTAFQGSAGGSCYPLYGAAPASLVARIVTVYTDGATTTPTTAATSSRPDVSSAFATASYELPLSLLVLAVVVMSKLL